MSVSERCDYCEDDDPVHGGDADLVQAGQVYVHRGCIKSLMDDLRQALR